MIDIEKIDDELYKATYGLPRVGNYNEIWSKIKNEKEILEEAIQIKRNKFNERDIVKGLTIASVILIDYESIDKAVYNNLINSIYTNKDIARIVMDVASNGGNSFLLMSLQNHNLKLTEEQKEFAINEAMNKIGTTRWKKEIQKESQKGSNYINYLISSLSDTQAHGTGAFDIRYHILRNPNWSLEEKQKLIMDFWYDDETYNDTLEEWEWGIINTSVNYKNQSMSLLSIDNLYEYSYDELLKFYRDKKVADKIWNEIIFCKQMHILRPAKWEIELPEKTKILTK